MESKELNELLVSKFPELKEQYQDAYEFYDGDIGSHVIYGDIFVPYIIEKLNDKDEPQIKKILAFIDELLNSKNAYYEEVIIITVIEDLMSDTSLDKEYLLSFATDKIKKAMQEVFEYYNK
jgi:hypothetical protein